MGLFGDIKKTKKSDFVVNKKVTLIDLHDEYIHFSRPGKEFSIFYKDIKNIEKDVLNIKIKTNVKEYKLTPRKLRGGKELANEMYDNLISKMSEVKK